MNNKIATTINAPFGEIVFKEQMKIDGKIWDFYEAFPNFGGYRGHNQAISYAKVAREDGLKARVVAKAGASAVYVRKN